MTTQSNNKEWLLTSESPEQLPQRTERELKPIYSNAKSFYGKAIITTDTNLHGTYYSLFSYGTFIIELKSKDNKQPFINATADDPDVLTNTTMRHVSEFLKQHNHETLNKKELEYMILNVPNNDY